MSEQLHYRRRRAQAAARLQPLPNGLRDPLDSPAEMQQPLNPTAVALLDFGGTISREQCRDLWYIYPDLRDRLSKYAASRREGWAS